MSFKSVLGKIGKIALTAAPYVAAPFTGGASLALTGVANKAVQKWSEKDAKANLAKGLAPSKFDSVLGKIGNYAGMASAVMPTGALGSIGLLGKAGSAAKAATTAANVGKAATTAATIGKGAKIASTIGKVANIAGPALGAVGAVKGMMGNNNSSNQSTGIGPSSTSGMAVPRGSNNFTGAAKYQQGMDLNNPNLANSIGAGRSAGVRDQGFRRGYDVTTRIGEPDEEGKYETRVTRMPKIQSDFGRPQRDMGSLIGGNRRKKQNSQTWAN